MEVNAVATTPSYNRTKKGAIWGAALGAATVGYQYGMVKSNFAGLKGAAISVKKDRIGVLKSMYESTGLFDMAKTTVSRIVKAAKKSVLSPTNIVATVGALTLACAGVGLAIDAYKNNKAKKSA